MEEFMFTSKYNDLYTPACRIALSAGDAWFFFKFIVILFYFFIHTSVPSSLVGR
jgi:hypothetical protein